MFLQRTIFRNLFFIEGIDALGIAILTFVILIASLTCSNFLSDTNFINQIYDELSSIYFNFIIKSAFILSNNVGCGWEFDA